MLNTFRFFFSRGRGDRTPVNGFGDRRTTAVLSPYGAGFSLPEIIIAHLLGLSQVYFSIFAKFYVMAVFGILCGGGRSRRMIIPGWTRSRSIGNVADARLENILAGVASNPRADVSRRSYQERSFIWSCSRTKGQNRACFIWSCSRTKGQNRACFIWSCSRTKGQNRACFIWSCSRTKGQNRACFIWNCSQTIG